MYWFSVSSLGGDRESWILYQGRKMRVLVGGLHQTSPASLSLWETGQPLGNKYLHQPLSVKFPLVIPIALLNLSAPESRQTHDCS